MSRSIKNKLKEYLFYKEYDYNCKKNGGSRVCCGERKRKRYYKEIRKKIKNRFKGLFLSNSILRRIRFWEDYW